MYLDHEELRSYFSPEKLLHMNTTTARFWKSPCGTMGLTSIYSMLGGTAGDPLSSKKERVFMAHILFPENKEVKKAYKNYFLRTTTEWRKYFKVTIKPKKFLLMDRSALGSWRDKRTGDSVRTVIKKIGGEGNPIDNRQKLKELLRFLYPEIAMDELEIELKIKK